MPKQVKKAVTKKPVVVMEQPTEFTDAPSVPENSVVEVDSKGVGDVVTPEVAISAVPTSREVEEQVELARMASRIAELETQNKELAARPQPAAQGQIVTRKNPGEDIVQRTAGGNTRTTHDPSPQLREEMATQEVAVNASGQVAS